VSAVNVSSSITKGLIMIIAVRVVRGLMFAGMPHAAG
jgi:hypothetical protein